MIRRSLLLPFLLATIAFDSFSIVRNTLKSGRWTDATVWGEKSAKLFPKDGDTIVISHYISLDKNLEFNNNQVTITKDGTICGYQSVSFNGTSVLINFGTISASRVTILRSRYRGDNATVINQNFGTIYYENSLTDCKSVDENRDCIIGSAPQKERVTCLAYPQVLFSINQVEQCKKTCFTLAIPSDIYKPGTTYSWKIVDGNTNLQTGTVTSEICHEKDTQVEVTLASTNALGSDTISKEFTNYIGKEVRLKVTEDTAICVGQTLKLRSIHTLNAVVWWQPATALSCNNCESPIFKPTKGMKSIKYIANIRNGACSATDSVSIQVLSNEADFVRDTLICTEGVLSIAGVFGNKNITWMDGSTLPYINISSSGEYSATISNECGFKKDTATVTYILPRPIILPNVFTPNGDGINDEYSVLNLDSYDESNFIIYNRWGSKIFETNSRTFAWDGKDQSDGMYYYQLLRKDCYKTEIKDQGIIQIVR